MRRLAILITLCLAPAALARAQDQAEPDTTGEHAGHAAMAAAGADDIDADWEKAQGHWAMVQSLSGPEKAEHLEMHRTILDELMGKLAGQSSGAEMKEGEGPTVGDRMEKADRKPVEGERADEMQDAAAAADDEGKTGERIDDARAEDAEAMGEETRVAALGDLQKHWTVVKDLRDPAQLETHLGMHMDMLDQALASEPAAAPGDTIPHAPPPGHEGGQHAEPPAG